MSSYDDLRLTNYDYDDFASYDEHFEEFHSTARLTMVLFILLPILSMIGCCCCCGCVYFVYQKNKTLRENTYNPERVPAYPTANHVANPDQHNEVSRPVEEEIMVPSFPVKEQEPVAVPVAAYTVQE